MADMLVMTPTRGRRSQCERLLKTFRETADNADITFITDDDDDAYEDMDWDGAMHAVMSPRGTLSQTLNATAAACVDAYDMLMLVADDHVFSTPHWDTIMLAELAAMGGTGFLYPDDKRRSDIPEIWAASSDIVRSLGFFAIPECAHFYIDNAVADLGRSAGLLRYCPQVVIEHLHYSRTGGERDATYAEAEDNHGASDRDAFVRWRAEKMPHQVARLRREFNPDVKWILGQI